MQGHRFKFQLLFQNYLKKKKFLRLRFPPKVIIRTMKEEMLFFILLIAAKTGNSSENILPMQQNFSLDLNIILWRGILSFGVFQNLLFPESVSETAISKTSVYL